MTLTQHVLLTGNREISRIDIYQSITRFGNEKEGTGRAASTVPLTVSDDGKEGRAAASAKSLL